MQIFISIVATVPLSVLNYYNTRYDSVDVVIILQHRILLHCREILTITKSYPEMFCPDPKRFETDLFSLFYMSIVEI
jgi:hypothetical protein